MLEKSSKSNHTVTCCSHGATGRPPMPAACTHVSECPLALLELIQPGHTKLQLAVLAALSTVGWQRLSRHNQQTKYWLPVMCLSSTESILHCLKSVEHTFAALPVGHRREQAASNPIKYCLFVFMVEHFRVETLQPGRKTVSSQCLGKSALSRPRMARDMEEAFCT